MQKCIVLAALAVSVVNAVTTVVPSGLDTLEQAILAASDGDVLQLEAGEYGFLNDILIDKQLTILGVDVELDAGESTVVVDSEVTPVVFRSSSLDMILKDLHIRDSATTGDCRLVRPIALYAGLDYTLTAPSLEDGRVNIQASMGEWYDGRHVQDFEFANCLHSANNGDGAIDRIEVGVDSTNCHGSLSFSVMFDQMISCGAVKSTTDESILYDAPLKVTVSEIVEWETYSENQKNKLAQPDTRVIDAVSSVRVQLGRKFTAIQEGSMLSSNYEKFDFEMVISEQTLPTVADALAGGTDAKLSKIELTLTLPSLYTIPALAEGDMKINTMANADPGNQASAWKLSSPVCDDPTARYCRQTIEFRVFACELTGTFELLNLPFECQASADACVPLEEADASTNLVLTLSSSDFCAANEVELDADFAATVHLMSDAKFGTEKDMSTGIEPDEVLFLNIKLLTAGSGLVIENGAIVGMERGSDDEDALCEDHALEYGGAEGIKKLVQNFIPQVPRLNKEDRGQPPQIHAEFMMNSNLACVGEGVEYEARNLDMKYIVSVTYTTEGGLVNGFEVDTIADELVNGPIEEFVEPPPAPIEEPVYKVVTPTVDDETPPPEEDLELVPLPQVPLPLRRRRQVAQHVRGRRLAADKEVDQQLLVKGKLAGGKEPEVVDPTLNMMLYGIGGAFCALLLSCCIGGMVLFMCYRRQARKVNQVALTQQMRGQMGKNNSSATNGMSGLSVFTDNGSSTASSVYEHNASNTNTFGAYHSPTEASPYPGHSRARMNDMQGHDSYDDMPALPYDDEPMGVDAYDSRPPSDGPNMKDMGGRFW